MWRDIWTVAGELSGLDYVAMFWFALCQLGYRWVTHRRGGQSLSFISAIMTQRRRWMQAMSERELRMVDIMISQSFNQMTGFFATTTVFILGSLAALLASGDNARTSLQSLALIGDTSVSVWTVKISALIVLFISAFFKFVWAHRLNQYLAVAIGATPAFDHPDGETRERQVVLATTLANRASVNTYAGLHAYYFAIAGLTWFIHAGVFIAATTVVVCVLYRREYISESARAIRDAAAGAVDDGRTAPPPPE